MLTCYPWQQTQWQSIVTRKKSGDFPHALLLTGVPGLGKADFANSVAALLLCTSNKDEPCGECAACSLLAAKTHPDFFVIQPEEPGKPIKIDQIRELISTLSNTAQQGGYQVVIIEPADAMNIAAANSLLKILEEPNEKVIFLLVTNKPHILPATIRSRCQQITFKVPETAIAKSWLTEQLPAASNLDLLLALTNNAPLAALEFVQAGKPESRQKFISALCSFFTRKLDPLAFATMCMDFEIDEVLYYTETIVCDLIKLKYNISDSLLNLDLLPQQQALFAKISLQSLHALYKKLLSIQLYLNRKVNLNKQMLLENLWLDWAKE